MIWEEIVKIYSESFPNEKARIVNTLVEIDPTNYGNRPEMRPCGPT